MKEETNGAKRRIWERRMDCRRKEKAFGKKGCERNEKAPIGKAGWRTD